MQGPAAIKNVVNSFSKAYSGYQTHLSCLSCVHSLIFFYQLRASLNTKAFISQYFFFHFNYAEDRNEKELVSSHTVCPNIWLIAAQYSKGGPIIAVQVENEYGSYATDENYMPFIKEVRR